MRSRTHPLFYQLSSSVCFRLISLFSLLSVTPRAQRREETVLKKILLPVLKGRRFRTSKGSLEERDGPTLPTLHFCTSFSHHARKAPGLVACARVHPSLCLPFSLSHSPLFPFSRFTARPWVGGHDIAHLSSLSLHTSIHQHCHRTPRNTHRDADGPSSLSLKLGPVTPTHFTPRPRTGLPEGLNRLLTS